MWAEIKAAQNKEAEDNTGCVIPLILVNSCVFSSAQDEKEEAVSYTLKQKQYLSESYSFGNQPSQEFEIFQKTKLMTW